MGSVRSPGQWRDRDKGHHCSFIWKEEGRSGVAWGWSFSGGLGLSSGFWCLDLGDQNRWGRPARNSDKVGS